MHLVIVDTAQIQPYIFGSNRLRENIGASYLVAQITGDCAKEAVQQVAQNSNVRSDGMLDDTKRIENAADKLDAEVLYAGGGNFVVLFRDEPLGPACASPLPLPPSGGNFVVLFRDEPQAKAFTRELSLRAMTQAPNLQLVIAQNAFDWSTESLSEKVKATFKKLAEEKRARTLSAPLLGLGVTAMCQSTGLPAIDMAPQIGDDPARPVSAEILAKLRVVEKKGNSPTEADRRLRELLPPPDGYDYPAQLDHLGGTKGEHNFIAVVHADGNGMGQRIMDIGKAFPNPSQNREYIEALRSFSETVTQAAQAALRETLNKLVAKIQNEKGKRIIIHTNASGKELVRIELHREGDQWFLPFRPIVFGGDDVTFVSDGRLGLSLAIEYMRQLEEHTTNLPDGKGQLTASAAVAIVKAHYPFARAYALADELCRKAKKYRKEILSHHREWDGSCLDWHFALSGLAGDIEEIRRREYTVSAGSLTLRPVALENNPKESHRTWRVVENGIAEFRGNSWVGRRNKLKALRDALRDGPDSVEHFLTKYNGGKPLPVIEPSLNDWPSRGWQGDHCGYFDALELTDWFIPL